MAPERNRGGEGQKSSLAGLELSGGLFHVKQASLLFPCFRRRQKKPERCFT